MTTMKDPPQLLRPTARLPSGGQSPTRYSRVSDDILMHLSPATAVDALASATGTLRACLDGASAAERDFVVRAAVASRKIWEWAEELSEWSWAAGSAGFETPSGRRRKLAIQITGPEGDDKSYMGSLPVEEVLRYERRMEEIYGEMEDLAVEDIKNHVLNNHIMPLSRPTSPMSDSRSILSAVSTFNRMEDLTAVITAIVVQTLPNMAKLSRLLQNWSIRVSVLHQVPSLLLAIEDAEVALRAGWNAILQASKDGFQQTPLTRKEFDIMKMVIEKKVANPGRSLDYMLDRLEGQQDTLPDAWLDRMETAERDFGEWVAACERKIDETEWAKSARVRKPISPIPEEPRWGELPVVNSADKAITLPVPLSRGQVKEPSKKARDARKASGDLHLAAFDGAGEEDSAYNPDETIYHEEDSLELPPLRDSSRRGSNESADSAILHGSHFEGSDLPDISASPGISAARVREAEYVEASPPSSPPFPGDDTRQSSSTASDVPTERGSPVDDDEESALPKTPTDGSFSEYYDDSFSTTGIASPSIRRDSSGDQQLRQQISEIIQGIPAKINLLSETGKPINLNPPDLQLPKMKKRPSIDRFRRSASSISSRGATPSFTLSPAKSARPRHQRGQQEIKVYHLARSTGEAPIKLFIRCVGERGERVMVRVGGGWADLSEYLKEYASHHGRRSAATDNPKVEIRDIPRVSAGRGAEYKSSPPSRPGSSLDALPMTPLNVRKTRKSVEASSSEAPRLGQTLPMPPMLRAATEDPMPSSDERFTRSRSNSRLSWVEDDGSFLGLAGPTAKKIEMSEENKAWVESVKEKVRIASGERKVSNTMDDNRSKFGELGKVGGTKRLFPKSEGRASRTEGRAVSRAEGRASRADARK